MKRRKEIKLIENGYRMEMECRVSYLKIQHVRNKSMINLLLFEIDISKVRVEYAFYRPIIIKN